MRRKIIGVLVCTLLIATVVPAVTSENENRINSVPEPSFSRPLFFLHIYAVGDSSSPINNFTGRFRFKLPFEFITNESYVRVTWGLLSPFPWTEWNITGPLNYNAFLFFGSVNKVHDKYIIEGRCIRFEIYP